MNFSGFLLVSLLFGTLIQASQRQPGEIDRMLERAEKLHETLTMKNVKRYCEQNGSFAVNEFNRVNILDVLLFHDVPEKFDLIHFLLRKGVTVRPSHLNRTIEEPRLPRLFTSFLEQAKDEIKPESINKYLNESIRDQITDDPYLINKILEEMKALRMKVEFNRFLQISMCSHKLGSMLLEENLVSFAEY